MATVNLTQEEIESYLRKGFGPEYAQKLATENTALIRRVERYEKALRYIVQRGYTGAEYVAREALKEEP